MITSQQTMKNRLELGLIFLGVVTVALILLIL